MTSNHLGESVHDLLDGRMNATQSASAMGHFAECEECSARWGELRTAREALNSSSVGIDMRFAQQLLDRDRMANIAKGESKHRARAAKGRNRRPVMLALSALAVAGAGVGAAYYVGGPDTIPVEFATASAATGGQSVAAINPAGMRSEEHMRAWVHPDWQDSGLVPIEARVVLADNGSDVLIVSLLAGVDPVVVTEQRGKLALHLVADLPRADVQGIDAYIVRVEPAQIVWQSGDVVVSMACDCAMVTLETVAGTFPMTTEPGFVDRIVTGLGELTGTFTGN